MLRAIGLACMFVACWHDPKPTAPGALPNSTIPGLVWSSPSQPWHAGSHGFALAVVGDEAVVTGWEGWVGRIDLTTGAVVHARWLDFDVFALVQLSDGRLLAVGQHEETSAAATLDPRTLVATSIPFPRGKEWRFVKAAVLPDGDVLVTGLDLPLAILEPTTWKTKRVLDQRIGWREVVVEGSSVLAVSEAGVQRFDLATGRRTQVGPGNRVAAGGGVIARRVIPDRDVAKLRVEVESGGRQLFTIENPHITDITIDAKGSRLIVTDEHREQLEIFELPSGRSRHTIPIGQGGAIPRAVTTSGRKVTFVADSILRIVDLDRGTITPAGSGPFGRAQYLAVDNGGAVSLISDDAFRIAGGKPTASEPMSLETRLGPTLGEVSRYAFADDTHVVIGAFGSSKVVHRWSHAGSIFSGWFDRDRFVVLALGTQTQLVRGDRAGVVVVATFDPVAFLEDVDFGTERAVVAFRGAAWIVSLRDGTHGTAIAIPSCKNNAVLEHGGRRVATFDQHVVAVWRGPVDTATRFADTVKQVVFEPGSDELVVVLRHRVMLWSPATGARRELALPGVTRVALSPDGKQLALALGDERVAVVDLGVLRAALPAVRAPSAPIPPACPQPDVFVE